MVGEEGAVQERRWGSLLFPPPASSRGFLLTISVQQSSYLSWLLLVWIGPGSFLLPLVQPRFSQVAQWHSDGSEHS